MNLDIQFKINNNNHYLKYLRENAYWYKILNRSPESFDRFSNEMKERYKLRPVDRINNVAEKMELVRSFFDALK